MGKTNIEWATDVWNPIRGCSRVSEGCRHCYAETVANRFKGPGQPYEGLIAKGGQWNGQIKLVPEMLEQPLRWRKPRRIFVNSMSDLFHENVPDEFIDKVFAVMAVATQHTFQVLTKRPHRMLRYMTGGWESRVSVFDLDATQAQTNAVVERIGKPLPNVWLGVSVEDQATADERIPLLLKTPAAVRWVSAEPLIGPVDLDRGGWSFLHALTPPPGNNGGWKSGLDWVVVGGESGKNARPMQADWARTIRDQCQSAGVPFFFKQWGEFAPNWFCDEDGKYDGGPIWMDRMGKRSAGRLLDGREWNEYPVVQP